MKKLLLLAVLSTYLPLYPALTSATPITYDESIDGDITGFIEILAGPGLNLDFDVGINTVSGTTTITADSHDDESFTFAIPTGTTLTNISVNGVTSGVAGGSWLWGIRETPTGATIAIDSLRNRNPSKDHFLSSIMPLAAGNYSFHLEGIGGLNHSLDYTFAFDVTAVPIPPALWLFSSGLLGLVGIARRKKAV